MDGWDGMTGTAVQSFRTSAFGRKRSLASAAPVQRRTAGFNQADIGALPRRGVQVKRTSGASG